MRHERLTLVLAAVLMAAPALAQSAESGGIGGTGISRETGGIGGTGLTRERQPVIAYGPIQAFGSVFVNGREYVVNSHTLVRVDGQPATISNLQVGDIARVRGVITGGNHGYAQNINIVHSVIGPVEQISADGRQAIILGQRLDALGKPIFAGLKPGEMVAVSAQLRANGTWAAGNVAAAPGAAAQLAGPFVIRNGAITVAGTPVTLASGLIPPKTGSQVLVAGTVLHNQLIVQRLAPGVTLSAPSGTRVEVSDYFKEQNGQLHAPDGLEITDFPNGDKLNGLEPVEVDGSLASPNVVDINAPEDMLNRLPPISVPEQLENSGTEMAPDELAPELPSEPPENPDLDDK